jgi:hypothetical protein
MQSCLAHVLHYSIQIKNAHLSVPVVLLLNTQAFSQETFLKFFPYFILENSDTCT